MIRNFSATVTVTALALILSACAGPAIPSSGAKSGSGSGSSSRNAPRPVVTPPPIVRPVQHNQLIGNSADALNRALGRPRIDITEGSGRKIQYQGTSCVLDVYFYPPAAGASAVATHVDARSPDGKDVDVNRCADSIRRR